jgi:lipopolysaccharide cholinephosphotransferase
MELNNDELKKRLVELLVKFDEICKINGLRYSLAYGTLLGAVRHEGFIPWDDDIDVIMPQNDYMKFLDLPQFKKQSLDQECVLYEVNNNVLISAGIPYMYPFAKLIDGKTYIKSDVFREVGGIWIDIFPVTGLPSEQLEIERHFNSMKRWRLQLAAAHRYRKLSKCSPISLLKQLRCNYYNLVHEKIVENMKAKAFHIPYDNSENVAVSIWNYGIREKMPRRYFDKFIDVKFEGKVFCGLEEYDFYLTKIYGNWRKVPPENQRIAHHYFNAFLK